MLRRKIEKQIIEYIQSPLSDPILIIDGARQIGKTFIINSLGEQYYENFISINFVEDRLGKREFANINNVNDFYFALSGYSGAKNKLNNDKRVLIFLDEIQEYPQFLTLLKFLKQDQKYKFICSGSLLGISLKKAVSIPIGSIRVLHMYPLDFEEFLWANGIGKTFIDKTKQYFNELKPLPIGVHNTLLDYFKKFVLIGGLPQAVENYINTNNIQSVRLIHKSIHDYYGDDASKYDVENKLKIRRIYDLIPSSLENTKKRVVIKNIEDDKWAFFDKYLDEFDYLISSGIATEVQSISNPVFPLLKSTRKNLVKFYLNDVGLLSWLFFENKIKPVMDQEDGVNIGSLYECAVANELKAHGYTLYYFDNKTKGEVDFLIDDYENLSVLPIEVKSGKNYYVHSALNNLMSCKDYNIKKSIVFNNNANFFMKNNILYAPIYFCMFLEKNSNNKDEYSFKAIKHMLSTKGY